MDNTPKMLADVFYESNKKTILYLVWLYLIATIFVVGAGYLAGLYDKDSTDGQDRSGMRLHKDNLTGCHYLSVKDGGITPRLDSSGSHYGCRR